MPRAFIVVDLGFGDAGKGLITDYLTRQTGAKLVVRFNGGAQAGHNVVTPEGQHHTFSQFGSGSFVPGVRTFLGRDVLIHPTALLREAEALIRHGLTDILDRLAISENARIITPFHQAAGRIRELSRNGKGHGTCGVGVGETVSDSLEHPEETLHARDLEDRRRVHEILEAIRVRKAAEVRALPGALENPKIRSEMLLLEDPDITDRWIRQLSDLTGRGLVVADDLLADWTTSSGTTIFEGSQGVLLDESWGFHPFTTWSDCTPASARSLLKQACPGSEIETIGVTRCYSCRHGCGPLPTETSALVAVIREHNGLDPWQGEIRYGWFDSVLTRYSIDVVGGVDRLAITHLDAPERTDDWFVATALRLADMTGSYRTIERLPRSRDSELSRQAAIAEMLFHVEPVLSSCPSTSKEVLKATEELLGQRADLVSLGPSAGDVGPRRGLLL